MHSSSRPPMALTALPLLVLVLGAQVATPRPAEAAPKIQGVGEVALGYTDNLQSAPDSRSPEAASRDGSVFLLLRPGIVFAVSAPRHLQRLSYTYTAELVVANADASTSSNQLGYAGFFDLSPAVGLVVGATAVQSNFSSVLLVAPPGAGAVNAVPAGSGSFLAGTASELLSAEVAVGWRAYEAVSLSAQTPLFETVAPRTQGAGGRLGLERTWEADAAGVEARSELAVITGSVGPDGSPLGEQRQLVSAGVGSWRHDWGPWLTSRAEAGVLRLQRLNTGQGFWAPTGAAALAYVTDPGDAELRYSRTVTTNPLLGQAFLVDEVSLRGGLPLTERGDVFVGATAAYQRGRLVEDDASLTGHVDVAVIDVGVGYRPVANLLLGLRYQHMEQISAFTLPELPSSFVRNSVLLGATVQLPPESAMPTAYRAPRRVDRADELRGPAGEPVGEPPKASAPARVE